MNDPTGVSIDSLCRPSSSPQAIAAGCATGTSAGVCGSCSDGFFLFRGGCYKAGQTPGSEICTKAEGGKCTTCNINDNYIFKNTAATVTLGNECILCSDITSRDGVMRVENCQTCTAPDSAGAATCSACQEGYYLSGQTCTPCADTCATCTAADTTSCGTCKAGYYLQLDHSCIEESKCTGANYPDKQSGQCKACSEITGCTACAYNDDLHLPICSACDNSKVVRTELDGSTTCVDEAGCKADSTHFWDTTSGNACIKCSDSGSGGVDNCKTCPSKGQCDSCVDRYFSASGSCTKCADNCATCTSAAINDCTACLPGYFLKSEGSAKECVPCDNVDKGGREGCSACSNTNAFKCTDCKPNYRKQPNGGAVDDYTCTKTCEDEAACGGTAGACGAIVVGGDGSMKYYCSQCRQQQLSC